MNAPFDGGAGAAADAARAHDLDPLRLSGQTVSNFRIGSALAAGGMGVVYRAEDMRLQRSVALKFPLPTLAVDRTTKERFLHEARSIGALDHPNICTIHEAGETADGHLFFAMPLYSGETLKDRLARDVRLDIDAAVSITQSVAAGLRAAHSRGIIHRDIKPSNVMLLDDGSVKILDFGLAKVQDLTLTEVGSLVGTVAYMAPEQIEGQPVDVRTDLWSMGVTLYEMITGQRPFAGEYDIALAYNILHTQAPAVSAVREGAPPQLERVVSTLLSRDPAMRYSSADELLTALQFPYDASADSRTSQVRSVPPHTALHNLFTRAVTHVRASTTRFTTVVVALILLVAASAAGLMLRGSVSPAPPKTLAVVPFTGPSENPDDRYLAVGLGDAIAIELGRLHPLVVPTSEAMADYRGSQKSVKEIAQEMEAAAVLRGHVKRVGDHVDASVTLTDGRTGKRIWSEQYNRPVDEMLDVQRDVAASVVKALHVRLNGTDRESLRRIPTKNAAAYKLYLQGREMELRDVDKRPGALQEQLRDLQSVYARARDADPDFALARARLALTAAYAAAASRDSTPGRDDHVRLEAEAALRLRPDLAEAHEALAMYYGPMRGNHAQAIEQLKLALLGAPNSTQYHTDLGTSYRNMGRWQDAVMEYDSAMHLEPRNPAAAVNAAITYSRLRLYEKAINAWNRAIVLAPNNTGSRVIRGHVFARWIGSVDTLEAALRGAPTWDPNGIGTWARHFVAMVRGDSKGALRILDASGTRIIIDAYLYRPIPLLRGQTYDYLGDHRRARESYQTALSVLLDSVAVHPGEGRIHAGLGLAYAGLGRKADAAREALAAMDAAPVRANHLLGTAMMASAAEIYARSAQPERAIELLELLLEMQAGREVSVPLLRIDPAFASLRSEPRFQQLLKRYD